MEGFTDVSTSVTTHPLHDPAQESQVRRESKVIDRHGLAARFLRIVHRVNMDQQKFVELEPLPKPEPLSQEDIAREAAEAAADREEKRQKLEASEAHNSQCRRKDVQVLGDAEALRQFDEEVAEEAARRAAEHEAERAAEEAAQWAEEKVEDVPRLAVVGSAGPAEPESAEEGPFRCAGSPQVEPSDTSTTEYSVLSTCEEGSQAQTRAQRSGMHELHKMHISGGEKSAATSVAAEACVENGPPEDYCEASCIAPAGGCVAVAADACRNPLGWKDGKRKDAGDRAPDGGVQRDEPGGDAVYRRLRKGQRASKRGPPAEGSVRGRS
jgi:hypothetical protein